MEIEVAVGHRNDVNLISLGIMMTAVVENIINNVNSSA